MGATDKAVALLQVDQPGTDDGYTFFQIFHQLSLQRYATQMVVVLLQVS